MKCINCGYNLPEGAKFCINCGEKNIDVELHRNEMSMIDQQNNKDSKKKYLNNYFIEFYYKVLQILFEHGSIQSPINPKKVFILNNDKTRKDFCCFKDFIITSFDKKNWKEFDENEYKRAKENKIPYYFTFFDFESIYDMTEFKARNTRYFFRLLNFPLPIGIVETDEEYNYEKIKNLNVVTLTINNYHRIKALNFELPEWKTLSYLSNIPIMIDQNLINIETMKKNFDSYEKQLKAKLYNNIDNAENPFDYIKNTLEEFNRKAVDAVVKCHIDSGVSNHAEIVVSKNIDKLSNIYKFHKELEQHYQSILAKVEEMIGDQEYKNLTRRRVTAYGHNLSGLILGELIAGGINKGREIISNGHFSANVQRFLNAEFQGFRNRELLDHLVKGFKLQNKVFINYTINNLNYALEDPFYAGCLDFNEKNKLSNEYAFYIKAMLFSFDNNEKTLHHISRLSESREADVYLFCIENHFDFYPFIAKFENKYLNKIKKISTLNKMDCESVENAILELKELKLKLKVSKFTSDSVVKSEINNNLFNLENKLSELKKKKKTEELIKKYKEDISQIKEYLIKNNLFVDDYSNFIDFQNLNILNEESKKIFKITKAINDEGYIPEISYYMGLFYCYGFGTSVDFPLALSEFEKYKNDNKGLALYHIAYIKRENPDYKEIQFTYCNLMLKSSKSDCAIANYQIGYDLMYKYNELWQSTALKREEALDYFELAIKQNNHMAEIEKYYCLKKFFPNKFYNKENINNIKQMTLLEKNSKDKQFLCKCYKLLCLYYLKNYDKEDGLGLAFSYLKKLIKLGDPYALFKTGVLFIEILPGIEINGIIFNTKYGIDLVNKAIECGCEEAKAYKEKNINYFTDVLEAKEQIDENKIRLLIDENTIRLLDNKDINNQKKHNKNQLNDNANTTIVENKNLENQASFNKEKANNEKKILTNNRQNKKYLKRNKRKLWLWIIVKIYFLVVFCWTFFSLETIAEWIVCFIFILIIISSIQKSFHKIKRINQAIKY